MGGAPCWKEILDSRNHLVAAMACMEASMTAAIGTGGSGITPTEEQRDAFLAQAEELAKISAGIEAYVRGE